MRQPLQISLSLLLLLFSAGQRGVEGVPARGCGVFGCFGSGNRPNSPDLQSNIGSGNQGNANAAGGNGQGPPSLGPSTIPGSSGTRSSQHTRSSSGAAGQSSPTDSQGGTASGNSHSSPTDSQGGTASGNGHSASPPTPQHGGGFGAFEEAHAGLRASNRQPSWEDLSMFPSQALKRQPTWEDLSMFPSQALKKQSSWEDLSMFPSQALKTSGHAAPQEVAEPGFDCFICQGWTPEEQKICGGCGHSYCPECAKPRIKMGFQKKALFPPGCCPKATPWPREQVWQSLDPQDQAKYANRETILQHVPREDQMECTDTCGMMYAMGPNMRDGHVIQCPHCHFRKCAKCKIPEHKDRRECKFNNEDEQNEASNLRRCPSCRNWVFKDGGCYHMQCDECMARFCWYCARQGHCGVSSCSREPTAELAAALEKHAGRWGRASNSLDQKLTEDERRQNQLLKAQRDQGERDDRARAAAEQQKLEGIVMARQKSRQHSIVLPDGRQKSQSIFPENMDPKEREKAIALMLSRNPNLSPEQRAAYLQVHRGEDSASGEGITRPTDQAGSSSQHSTMFFDAQSRMSSMRPTKSTRPGLPRLNE